MRPPGPPAPTFAARPPGPPPPAFGPPPGAVQRHGTGGGFAIEAGALGLASGGGKPLPDVVRGKMEAALSADFSNVRVHVGPQAERIGAIAFTIGSEIYFAPGRYQPDTPHGQQLLGHELAHVVQQRQGRVRNPMGSGFAVVQDRALEAEADRIGQRAASYPVELQAKMMPAAPFVPAVRISSPGTGDPNASRAMQVPSQRSPAPAVGQLARPQIRAQNVLKIPSRRNEWKPGNVVQRRGNPPYKKEISISTTYLTLRFEHPRGGAQNDTEAEEYVVKSLDIHSARPPVYLEGIKETNQGQHKVAYAGIAAVLHLMEGQNLSEAQAALQTICVGCGAPMVVNSNVKINVVGGASSPQAADDLIIQAHNYLVSMQRDDPSWKSDDPDQLKGKGERSLRSHLRTFQRHGPVWRQQSALDMFDPGGVMDKLVDLTGRTDEEMDDAEDLVRRNLMVHIRSPGYCTRKPE
jgi:Domain of unknown function (DUF4157)